MEEEGGRCRACRFPLSRRRLHEGTADRAARAARQGGHGGGSYRLAVLGFGQRQAQLREPVGGMDSSSIIVQTRPMVLRACVCPSACRGISSLTASMLRCCVQCRNGGLDLLLSVHRATR